MSEDIPLFHGAVEEALLVPHDEEYPAAVAIVQEAEIAAASDGYHDEEWGNSDLTGSGAGGRDLSRVWPVLCPCLIRVWSVSSRR